ncbi:MAG: UvrD-helicase domain-containing protein [Calditrichaeota bacterium]|nr:UvrD-helicase domain-containing protein [Calditrichota bacterium]
MALDLLSDLNPQQREAVEYLDGPLLVLAGAGSGKTRVLTYKIAYLIQKDLVRPWEILAVTFTNKAANEMKHRVEKLLNMPITGLWIGTFHSICARILRREAARIGYSSNFTIYDVDNQLNHIQRIMEFLNIDKDQLKPRHVQYVISQNKNQLISPETFDKKAINFVDKQIARIYWEYEVALRRNNAFDFDDLLLKPLEIFTQHHEVLEYYQKKFKYILVDEYQDTNKAQYYFIKMLSAEHRQVCVVGDEDQSIYRWRGADIENILRFEKDFPGCKVVRLEKNYRSTQRILNAANAVVAHNLQRLGKDLWSDRGEGEKIRVIVGQNEQDEARQVVHIIEEKIRQEDYSLKDIAILYRTNAQSRVLEDQLRLANIPYQIIGGVKFYERKEVKDVLAYFRVLVNPDDSVSLQRIINVPARGIGAVTVNRVLKYAQEKEISMFQALQEVDQIPDLTPSARTRIQVFVQQLEAFQEMAERENAFEIASQVVDTFRLREMYERATLPEDKVRVENINELLNSVAIFVKKRPPEEARLVHYLEEVSLVTDIDRWNPENPSVTLMTLHSAKGLEFPVVIITGLENGLFPLHRSLENQEELEEERRLFYVGMTRAKDELYLLWARTRHRFLRESFGQIHRNEPSKFLSEIPKKYLQEMRSESTGGATEGLEEFFHGRPSDAVSALEDQSSFQLGQWVFHENFGKGQIVGVEPSSRGTKLTIVFNNKKIMKIIAEYANLQVVDTSD